MHYRREAAYRCGCVASRSARGAETTRKARPKGAKHERATPRERKSSAIARPFAGGGVPRDPAARRARRLGARGKREAVPPPEVLTNEKKEI